MMIAMTGLLFSVTGCGESGGERVITQQEFGNKWPFTVPEGRLVCTPTNMKVGKTRIVSVTLDANGTTYAINGTAANKGFRDISPIWKYDDTWAEHYAKEKGVTLEVARDALGPMRVSVTPIIDAGLALCNE